MRNNRPTGFSESDVGDDQQARERYADRNPLGTLSRSEHGTEVLNFGLAFSQPGKMAFQLADVPRDLAKCHLQVLATYHVLINDLADVRKLTLRAALDTFFTAFDLVAETFDESVRIRESLLNALELLSQAFDPPVGIGELLLSLLELLSDTCGSTVGIRELLLKHLQLLHGRLQLLLDAFQLIPGGLEPIVSSLPIPLSIELLLLGSPYPLLQ